MYVIELVKILTEMCCFIVALECDENQMCLELISLKKIKHVEKIVEL